VPSRREIEWSQLRVGALVLIATAVLIALIFLMSASTGGIFAKKILLRSYFTNAAGLKNGAPVTLQGVTIGNVKSMRVDSSHNPTPVEVTMEVSRDSRNSLHTDSTAMIAQAGVLGDSYVDIDSTKATGPQPPLEGITVLPASEAPTVQDVIRTSEDSIKKVQELTGRLNTLAASLNDKKGLVGALINDPVLTKKVQNIATNLETVTGALASDKGTLGKLITDDTLYNRAEDAVDKLDQITTSLNEGKGTMGKLLHDDSLYNNVNAAVANTNQLVAGINQGQGALGKIAKDPEFAKKLDDTVTNLNGILKSINEGQGTIGQLVQNRTVYDHFDQTLDQAQQLLQAFRADPKKYLQIHFKLF
jgi:phospholipid/cholesterol/gamma-HCH transport system substrate-binding protein